MVHADGSAWLNPSWVFFHHQQLGAWTHHIPIHSTTHTADISACCHSCSLCALWVCHLKESYSYVFSRWISRSILPFHSDRLYYCRSHCTTHPLHMVGYFIPHLPNGAPTLEYVLLNLDWHFDISFCAPQFPLRPQFGMPLFHSILWTSLLPPSPMVLLR